MCLYLIKAPPPDPSRIPSSDLLDVTVVLLTCLYKDQEFIRIGYYVHNEYSEDHDNNTVIKPEKIIRNILHDKPRVTRFNIGWDNDNKENSFKPLAKKENKYKNDSNDNNEMKDNDDQYDDDDDDEEQEDEEVDLDATDDEQDDEEEEEGQDNDDEDIVQDEDNNNSNGNANDMNDNDEEEDDDIDMK